jgi:hypothetical protein
MPRHYVPPREFHIASKCLPLGNGNSTEIWIFNTIEALLPLTNYHLKETVSNSTP